MDKIESEDAPVIIAGFGRMGNMIGRFLEVNGVRTTVLDHNLDVVDVVRKLGLRACYGDAFRDMSKHWGDRKTFLEKRKGKIQEAKAFSRRAARPFCRWTRPGTMPPLRKGMSGIMGEPAAPKEQ